MTIEKLLPAYRVAAWVTGIGLVILVFVALLMFVPFAFSLATSLKTPPEAAQLSFGTMFWPNEPTLDAYRTALEGFAQPYGDVAVGGWRNTPYVVIQNVGAYLDVPRFLDADHPVRNAADAEAYLARLDSYPVQLDGELGRL